MDLFPFGLVIEMHITHAHLATSLTLCLISVILPKQVSMVLSTSFIPVTRTKEKLVEAEGCEDDIKEEGSGRGEVVPSSDGDDA